MASFRQHGNGWQGRIRRRGYPDIVKTFQTKADVEKWSRSIESEIDKVQFVSLSEAQRTTLDELIPSCCPYETSQSVPIKWLIN